MTELSSAATAVLNAYMDNCGWLDGPFEKDYRCAAAVLRAAADQVVPAPRLPYDSCCDVNAAAIRAELLAIAIELETQ
jgi:hypothetical protein